MKALWTYRTIVVLELVAIVFLVAKIWRAS